MNKIVKPTQQLIEWSNKEIGVIISFDINVYDTTYDWTDIGSEVVDLNFFNPIELNTDQWIRTAKESGAKYAVLVAKHCTGFCLWPTKAHGYSVKNTPWRNGQGDIVKDFIQSCKKYDMKPGIYYSTAFNTYLKINNSGRAISGKDEDQKKYNAIVEQQLTELWSQYGELFEIWFDGGVLPTNQGGPNILPLLRKYQPNAVCFQGPREFRHVLRWVGNEKGIAPKECWSTVTVGSNFNGIVENSNIGQGDKNGQYWAPAESDMPIRKADCAYEGGWFWKEGEDSTLYNIDELVECYYTSVGRNTNLLLGMVIDTRGLVPDADVNLYKRLGKEIKRRFETPIATTSNTGDVVKVEFEKSDINQIVIMEDLTKGHLIHEFVVEAYIDRHWCKLFNGNVIGHKRIERFETIATDAVRIRCTNCVDVPTILELSAYYVS